MEHFGEVQYLPGASITPSAVKQATALIVRTRTRCDAALLDGSSVTCIVTATIGYDHIDTDYCDEKGIRWMNAPGCNARSVEQYVTAALLTVSMRKGFSLKGKTLGVIGVGHVGSKVAAMAEWLGMRVLLNDPVRSRKEGSEGFYPLDLLLSESDIISLHVPLTHHGEDATFHLVNESFLKRALRCPILINTCRGEVMDTTSVVQARSNGSLSGLIVDCWENEPAIDTRLLDLADIGTPHIAGYSRDGKANATTMAVRAVSRFLNLGLNEWQTQAAEDPQNPVIFVDGTHLSEEAILARVILQTYRIEEDDEMLRRRPGGFEQARGDYPVRREYEAYTVRALHVPQSVSRILEQLGFNLLHD